MGVLHRELPAQELPGAEIVDELGTVSAHLVRDGSRYVDVRAVEDSHPRHMPDGAVDEHEEEGCNTGSGLRLRSNRIHIYILWRVQHASSRIRITTAETLSRKG